MESQVSLTWVPSHINLYPLDSGLGSQRNPSILDNNIFLYFWILIRRYLASLNPIFLRKTSFFENIIDNIKWCLIVRAQKHFHSYQLWIALLYLFTLDGLQLLIKLFEGNSQPLMTFNNSPIANRFIMI